MSVDVDVVDVDVDVIIAAVLVGRLVLLVSGFRDENDSDANEGFEDWIVKGSSLSFGSILVNLEVDDDATTCSVISNVGLDVVWADDDDDDDDVASSEVLLGSCVVLVDSNSSNSCVVLLDSDSSSFVVKS